MIWKKLLPAAIVLIILITVFIFLRKQKPEQVVVEDICNEIQNKFLINVCHALTFRNISACEDAGGYDILCFDLVSQIIDPSEELCNSVQNEYGKLRCFRQLAKKTGDPSFCMNNDDCYLELATITSNPSVCEFFPYGSVDKDLCIALSKQSRDYCKDIQTEYGYKLCISYFPQTIDDCMMWGNYDIKCLCKLASEKKDPALCEELADYHKLECILNIDNNKEVCMRQKGPLKDMCIIYYLRNKLMKRG